MRWALQLLEFDFEVIHRPGKKSLHVDALSRIPLQDTNPYQGDQVEGLYDKGRNIESLEKADWMNSSRDYDLPGCHSLMSLLPRNVVTTAATTTSAPKIAEDALETLKFYQRRSIKVSHIRELINTPEGDLSQSKKSYRAQFRIDHRDLVCRKYNGRDCIYVPPSLVREILYFYHGLPMSGHLGGKKLVDLIRRNFWWKNLDKHCTAWTSACEPCIKRKAPQPARQGLAQTMNTSSPFWRVAIDHVVGLTCSDRDNKDIFTAIDCFTRWAFAVPVRGVDAINTAEALWNEVVSVHGPMRHLLSDRGSAFISDVIKGLCKFLGIKKLFTMPHCPNANGHVERFHRFLGATLTFMVNRHHTDWDLYINAVLWVYRISIHASIGISPFMALYGRNASLPIDLALDDMSSTTLPEYVDKTVKALRSVWKHLREQQERLSRSNLERRTKAEGRIHVELEPGDPVFLFENTGVRKEDDKANRNKVARDLKNRKTTLTKKFLYRYSGPHRIHAKISNNAYQFVDGRTGKIRDANVRFLRLWNPWDDSWENQPEHTVQDFVEREVVVLRNDICIIRFAQECPEDPPWGVVKILQKNNDDTIVAQWMSNYKEALLAKHLPGWIDAKGKHYYKAKPQHPSHEPYTNLTAGVALRVSDIAYSGIKINEDGTLEETLIKAICADPTINFVKPTRPRKKH